jgi:hypothetical protein
MKHQLFVAMLLMSFFMIATAVAQPAVTKQPLVSNATILFWANDKPIDWFSGLALAFTGAIGALVTVFFLIGGAVPGTVGKVNIDYDAEQLKEYKEKLKVMWSKELTTVDLEKAKELKSMVYDFSNQLNKERWHQFSLAAILYVAIGAFFAAFLARDILQALIIGAGWTGYLGALGLKSDAEERGSRKNDKIDELVGSLKEKDKIIEDKSRNIEYLTKKLKDIHAAL